MKKRLLYLAICLFLNINTFAVCNPEGNRTDSINDGPYIFDLYNKFAVRWIDNSVFRTEFTKPNDFPDVKKKFNLLFDYKDLKNTRNLEPEYRQTFIGVDSIAAISDIHGAYDNYINLLKSLGIIDKNLNWKFGKGHLVVLGDIFDRGSKVTEVLWHLFGLENQALKAGGMVHIVLGNHEALMFSKDLRYMNEKYVKVAAISGIPYSSLYSEDSVLGKWLRCQPAILTINDIIFVHGGLSIEMVHRKLTIEEINHIFSDMIQKKQMTLENEVEDLKFLNDDEGPVWYRGFFTDKNFCESQLDSILNFYAKKHIVVGHTTFNEIRSLFDTKIIAIDAGLMNDKSGEMLIYKKGRFYKCLATGERIEF